MHQRAELAFNYLLFFLSFPPSSSLSSLSPSFLLPLPFPHLFLLPFQLLLDAFKIERSVRARDGSNVLIEVLLNEWRKGWVLAMCQALGTTKTKDII